MRLRIISPVFRMVKGPVNLSWRLFYNLCNRG